MTSPGLPEISFSSWRKTSAAEPAICREKRAPRIDGPIFALPDDVIMGNGTVNSPALAKDARVPLPIIGVGGALVQGGAHDDAPPYDHSRRAALCLRAALQGLWIECFSGGWGCRWIRGLRAENADAIGIEPVHTRVDSCGLSASGRAGRPAGPNSIHHALAQVKIEGSISGLPRGRAASGRSHFWNRPRPAEPLILPSSITTSPRDRVITG